MRPVNTLAVSLMLASSALMTLPVSAHDYTQGEVSVAHPWSRPTPPGTPMGVGYMAISNGCHSEITLVAAETPRAESVSIHESITNDGVMSMRPLDNGLTIPAGETVELKPHGYHLMLEKLSSPLQEGERIPLTLTFDGAPAMKLELSVDPLDAAPMHEDGGMEDHGHH